METRTPCIYAWLCCTFTTPHWWLKMHRLAVPLGVSMEQSEIPVTRALSIVYSIACLSLMPTPTNETDPIVRSYADSSRASIMSQKDSHELESPLPPEQILRFYQAYMVSWSIQNALPMQRKLSVSLAIKQLWTSFLVAIIWIAICIIATLVRYTLFYRRHTADLEASQAPDATLDWMLLAKHVGEIVLAFPDRDLLKTAAYGAIKAPAATVRGLPRVYSIRLSDEKLPSGNQSQVDQSSVVTVLSETNVSGTPNTQGTEN